MKKKSLLLLCCLMMVFAVVSCKQDKTTITDGEQAKDMESITDGNEDSNMENKDESVVKASEEATEQTVEDSKQTTEAGAEVSEQTADVKEGEHYITTTFTSKALTSAKDGSSPVKDLKIYLPPNYYTSQKRYPVVYFFHGYGDSMNFISANQRSFDKLMVEPDQKEFIVVEVDGRRASINECSFWVNSPVTGQWEDYVIDEIIPYIDQNYNTVAKVEARGIAGFSMGGFACLNLAFRHPDVFSGVLSLCPGLLKDGSLNIAMNSWGGDTTFLTCYGQAFAPNEESEKLCDIPVLDGTPEDNEIAEKWYTGFGNLEAKIEAYLSKEQSLKAIQIVYGTSDYYKWIPEGCISFSELLTKNSVEHTLTAIPSGHTIPAGYAKDYFIPFFSENLVSE